METETNSARCTALDDIVEVRAGTLSGAAVVLRDRIDGQMILLETEGLQALVQWAYDQHGILAEPSLHVEAEHAPAEVTA